jgi:hypothetical protein
MHVYEDIRDELKKNKYVIYIVENNKFELAFKFNGKKSELKEKITKKYLKKNKPDMFFVCFKFSFHTGTKQFQGGPLAVNLATFMFVNDELVNGAIHSKICARFMWKVWFSRIFLEESGWKDLYFEKIIKKLLSNKVTLYPLIANSYVEFKY